MTLRHFYTVLSSFVLFSLLACNQDATLASPDEPSDTLAANSSSAAAIGLLPLPAYSSAAAADTIFVPWPTSSASKVDTLYIPVFPSSSSAHPGSSLALVSSSSMAPLASSSSVKLSSSSVQTPYSSSAEISSSSAKVSSSSAAIARSSSSSLASSSSSLTPGGTISLPYLSDLYPGTYTVVHTFTTVFFTSNTFECPIAINGMEYNITYGTAINDDITSPFTLTFDNCVIQGITGW